METPFIDKDSQVRYLKESFNYFCTRIRLVLEPENTDLEDIDRLITMIDDLEDKCEQFKKSMKNEKESAC